jgi:hypothetical protein
MVIVTATGPALMVWGTVINTILVGAGLGLTVTYFLFFPRRLKISAIIKTIRIMTTTIAIQVKVDIFNLPDIL